MFSSLRTGLAKLERFATLMQSRRGCECCHPHTARLFSKGIQMVNDARKQWTSFLTSMLRGLSVVAGRAMSAIHSRTTGWNPTRCDARSDESTICCHSGRTKSAEDPKQQQDLRHSSSTSSTWQSSPTSFSCNGFRRSPAEFTSI